MFAIGFDFHSVEPTDPFNVRRGYVAGGIVLRIDWWHNAPHPVVFMPKWRPVVNARGIKTRSPFLVMNLIEKATSLPSGVSFASNSLSERLRRMVCISTINLVFG